MANAVVNFILTFSYLIVVCAECPIGWHHYDESCYYFSHTSLNWLDAMKSCQGLNAWLAEPQSDIVAQYLRFMANLYGNSTGFWIGGRDVVIEGRWTWSHSGKIFDYTDWAPHEPSGGGVDVNCAWMWPNEHWHWDDASCNALNRYICQSRLPDSSGAVVG